MVVHVAFFRVKSPSRLFFHVAEEIVRARPLKTTSISQVAATSESHLVTLSNNKQILNKTAFFRLFVDEFDRPTIGHIKPTIRVERGGSGGDFSFKRGVFKSAA